METTDKRIELIQKITTMEVGDIEIINDTKQWPQVGDKCYELEPDGDIDADEWEDHPTEKRVLLRGLIFHTREAARKEDDSRILIQELKEFAGDQSWIDWDNINQPKHYIYFCNKSKSWDWEIVHLTQIIGQTYYKSKTSAEKALDHFGDRLNLLK